MRKERVEIGSKKCAEVVKKLKERNVVAQYNSGGDVVVQSNEKSEADVDIMSISQQMVLHEEPIAAADRLQFNEQGWCNVDYTDEPFLHWLFERTVRDERRVHLVDVVVSNPDFDVGLQTLFLGLCALKPNGLFFAILPSDFMEGSESRAKVIRALDFHIEHEYKVGHQAYYTGTTSEKRTCDSLFVLRKGSGNNQQSKFCYSVSNARLQGLL